MKTIKKLISTLESLDDEAEVSDFIAQKLPVFSDETSRPPLMSFIKAALKHPSSPAIIPLSSLFDMYAPSSSLIQDQNEHGLWLHLHFLDMEKREKDQQFFLKLCHLFREKKLPILSLATDLLILSMIKYSGLLSRPAFNHWLISCMGDQGSLLWYNLDDDVDADTEADPSVCFEILLKLAAVMLPQKTCIDLISALTEHTANEDFDLDRAWFNHSEALSLLPTQPLSKSYSTLLSLLSEYNIPHTPFETMNIYHYPDIKDRIETQVLNEYNLSFEGDNPRAIDEQLQLAYEALFSEVQEEPML